LAKFSFVRKALAGADVVLRPACKVELESIGRAVRRGALLADSRALTKTS